MRKSDAYLLFIKIRSKFYRSRKFHYERIILVLSLGFSYVFFLLQFFESQTLFVLRFFLREIMLVHEDLPPGKFYVNPKFSAKP